MGNNNSKKNKLFEKTLDSISNRKKAPIYSYVILLLLYIATSTIVTMSAGSKTAVSILGTEMALYTFAGVFSALSNICIIFMTLYHGKLGFFTSLAVGCSISIASSFPNILKVIPPYKYEYQINLNLNNLF